MSNANKEVRRVPESMTPVMATPEVLEARRVVDRNCSMGCTVSEWNRSLDHLIGVAFEAGSSDFADNHFCNPEDA